MSAHQPRLISQFADLKDIDAATLSAFAVKIQDATSKFQAR